MFKGVGGNTEQIGDDGEVVVVHVAGRDEVGEGPHVRAGAFGESRARDEVHQDDIAGHERKWNEEAKRTSVKES